MLINRSKQIHNKIKSNTLYVGNLSFKVREEKLWGFFTGFGEIKRIITGINRIDLSQCGFCFIEFCYPKISIICFLNINGIRLYNRVLKIDLDEGFTEGRQFGRGKRGGQMMEDPRPFNKKQKFLKKRMNPARSHS